MSNKLQYLQDLKTHQEEELEIVIQKQNKPEESDDSEDDQNEVLNLILQCQQKGLSEKVFDFHLGKEIKLTEASDMNKSALYLDALAWLYSNRVDRTYVESLKLKVNLLRVYDQTTPMASTSEKKEKQSQQPSQKPASNIIRHVEQKDITKYGESTLDFKPYTHLCNTLQINPFFNQTSKSLDMQDLSTLIIYNPQFDENLAIIIDPDQLLQTPDPNKQILTGFIKLEIDTSELDYANLMSKQFKMNFTEINEFRERYKCFLNKKDVSTVKIEKSQQLQIDQFVSEFRVYDEKLKQAQQVIEGQQQQLSQINAEDQQFENLNLQYQQQLQINQQNIEQPHQEETLKQQIEQLQLGPPLLSTNQEQLQISQAAILKQQQLQQEFKKYHLELLEEQKKQQQLETYGKQVNQMEIEEFNNQLPDFQQEEFGSDIYNNLPQENEPVQIQQEPNKLTVDEKISLQEQFKQQQKEALEKKQQLLKQQEQEKKTYQQQYQDIFNDINANAPIDEWEMDPEEEFDQELPPYEEQQQQLQKQIDPSQQQQEKQPIQQSKKKQKKVYPETFDFTDAHELDRLTIINSVGNNQRDFGQRELTLKNQEQCASIFDCFRFFEFFSREYPGCLEEEEQLIPIAEEPENIAIDTVEYENLPLQEIRQMIESYQEELDHYIVPFKVQPNNSNEPTTIKQLQIILERVIESIDGNIKFLKLEKTLPLIMTEKVSKSKLFASLLFVSKSKGYKLEQKDQNFKDITIVKNQPMDIESQFER